MRRAERGRRAEAAAPAAAPPADRTPSRSSGRSRRAPPIAMQRGRAAATSAAGPTAQTARSRPRRRGPTAAPISGAVEALGAPVQGREAVVERVAALDHARGQHHGEKRRVAQQDLRRLARGAVRGRPRAPASSGVSASAAATDEHQREHDQPDQMAGRDRLQHQARADIAGDEGDRAPQPHRAVAAAARAKPRQRIGVRQRQHRRQRHHRHRERREDGDRRRPPARPRSCRAGPTTEPITSVAFSARCRSAAWVMIGVATIRTSVGTAMTMPMVRASRPLASSQSGKNGNWTPPKKK